MPYDSDRISYRRPNHVRERREKVKQLESSLLFSVSSQNRDYIFILRQARNQAWTMHLGAYQVAYLITRVTFKLLLLTVWRESRVVSFVHTEEQNKSLSFNPFSPSITLLRLKFNLILNSVFLFSAHKFTRLNWEFCSVWFLSSLLLQARLFNHHVEYFFLLLSVLILPEVFTLDHFLHFSFHCAFFTSNVMFLNMRSFTIVLILLNVSKVYGNNKECDAMDIRVYKDLDRLSNCTVILGNLALVISPLFEPDYSPEEINKRTFPLRWLVILTNLNRILLTIFHQFHREVTGYVLFYSLTYLNSLGTMFPNLTVIRGHRLFSNYALVIYDSDLQQVRLSFRSLTFDNLIFP